MVETGQGYGRTVPNHMKKPFAILFGTIAKGYQA
jgi:hypothetical protein